MTAPDDKERELKLREAELKAKERELRLRELETEIYQEQKRVGINSPEPPLYRTEKHQKSETSIQKFGKKIVKFAKFTGFVVLGIAFIRVGFFVGMWITYIGLASIIAFIGYQIFLKDD